MKLEVWQVDRLGPVRLGRGLAKVPESSSYSRAPNCWWLLTTLRKDLSFPNEGALLASVGPTVGRHLNLGGAQWWQSTVVAMHSSYEPGLEPLYLVWALVCCIPCQETIEQLILKVPGPQHLCLQMQTRRVAFTFKLARWFHLLIQHVYYVTALATACSHHHCCYPHYQNSEVRRQVPMLLKGDDI